MLKPESKFFVGVADGALYDLTLPCPFTQAPLRKNFKRHHRTIETLADLKATLRAGPYAFPGGYPLYFITSDGAALAFKTVREEWRQIVDAHLSGDTGGGWHVAACDINYEDTSLFCDHSSEKIEAAYTD